MTACSPTPASSFSLGWPEFPSRNVLADDGLARLILHIHLQGLNLAVASGKAFKRLKPEHFML